MTGADASDDWINALAGTVSATGRRDERFRQVVQEWCDEQVDDPRSQENDDMETMCQTIAKRLRTLTGQDASIIDTCLAPASVEQALQWAVVLARREFQRRQDDLAADAHCLCAVGSDHGDGVVGRMAGGRVDARDPAWPLVPGFVHAAIETLAERIDEQIAMVFISPVCLHDRVQAVSADTLREIREACDRHDAILVVDHRQLPAMGGGRFWVHEAIADVTADAVIASAGLLGGNEGALLVLNPKLSESIEPSMRSHPLVARLVQSALDEFLDADYVNLEIDQFPVVLAERLARRESVRDLNVIGRTIGIELDLPSMQWCEVARQHHLQVAQAGEFAIALQPPLVFDSAAQSNLLERIDRIFDHIEADEQSEKLASDDKKTEDSDEDDQEYETEDVRQDDTDDLSDVTPDDDQELRSNTEFPSPTNEPAIDDTASTASQETPQ